MDAVVSKNLYVRKHFHRASRRPAHLESVQVTALVGISYLKHSFVDTRPFPPQDMRNRFRGNPWDAGSETDFPISVLQTFL
jgi:hypothetical protein